MFLTKKHLSRRTLLKGAGIGLALPLLDAMIPAATALAQTVAAPQLRAGFFYLPHGAIMGNTDFGAQMDRWTPSGSGTDFRLNAITKPLESYKRYVTSFGNIKNDAGSGTHTRRPGTWLADLKSPQDPGSSAISVTLDQVIAAQIGKDSQFPSLEIASETTVQQAAGNGVNTSITLSFRDAEPLRVEYNPRKLFVQLFMDEKGGAITKQIAMQDASLLDHISEGTRELQRGLDPSDQAILDSYLTAVREAERRVEKRIKAWDRGDIQLPVMPSGVQEDFDQQIKLMFDLVTIAYRADMTRVVSFMMAAEGTNVTYPHIGVPESFHPLSHHANEFDRINKLVKIQTWHMEAFADFLGGLAAIREGDGTLLDNMMFLYGSNMSNSSAHSSQPLPTLLVGGGAGNLTGGRHIELPKPTPIANLHLTLLDKVGIERKRFGDSTGTIAL